MCRRSRLARSRIFGLLVISLNASLPSFTRIIEGRPRYQQVVLEAAGDLDPSFGTGGKVTTDFSGNNDGAYGIAIQSDGKLVVVGYSSDAAGQFRFAVARYNVNGSLDTAFGVGGKATEGFFQLGAVASGVVLQSDGKIVVGGYAAVLATRSEFALARFNSDGSLDNTFGSNGKVTADFPGKGSLAYGLALGPNGKIVQAGYSRDQAGLTAFAVARYNQDGSLDASFGSGGRVTSKVSNASFDIANAVAVQPDNQILIAGSSGVPGPNPEKFAVARYNANGGVDTSFGTGGAVTPAVSMAPSSAAAIALQSDGRIVVAGTVRMGASADPFDFALARYNSNGTLDLAFSGGTVTTDLSGHNDEASSIAIQDDGKILVAGFSNNISSKINDTGDFAIARYNPDGTLDTRFGGGGIKVTDFFAEQDFGSCIALQQDGKIVVAGHAKSTSAVASSDFALVRYMVDPDFSLSFNQTVVSADRGTKVPVNVLINRKGGFTGNVTVTPPDLSAIGVKVKPPDPQSTSDPSVRVKLKVKASAVTGPHQLVFTGMDDSGRVRTAAVSLTIQ